MTSAFERSFKNRLHLIAQERHLTPAAIWQNVITERFLVRLSQSSYQAHFVLKGGTLLARYVDIGRETMDVDFAIQRISNEIGVLQKTFDEIVRTKVDDGFVFSNPVVVPLEHFHMQYPGAHVRVDVHFGKSKFPLFIDLGFGDVVPVSQQKILLLANSKGPLFEPSLTVQCYPVEFIFAEKLETAVFRGAENSRMKDFHDLYSLASSKTILSRDDVVKAVRLVFEHRKTPLRLPLNFDLSTLEALQKYWIRYHKTATARLPNQIAEIIGAINRVFVIP
jgi:predicted nucleotidyltransferase component of viral defense system